MKGVKKKNKTPQETIYFPDEEEYNLLKDAIKIYGGDTSVFLRKIISFWLWSNKLQIENYNGKTKRTKK